MRLPHAKPPRRNELELKISKKLGAFASLREILSNFRMSSCGVQFIADVIGLRHNIIEKRLDGHNLFGKANALSTR